MNIEIRDENFKATLYGFSSSVPNKEWGKCGMITMDKMWKQVKSNNLKNKGINVWVYEKDYSLFTGVELESEPPAATGLEKKEVNLSKYAYYKHIGSYDKLKDTFEKLSKELNSREIKTTLPYLEIYGHWTEDESKLETEIIWNLE